MTKRNLRTPVLRRSFRREFPVAVRGEGVYVWSAEGKRYLDLSAAAAVNFAAKPDWKTTQASTFLKRAIFAPSSMWIFMAPRLH
jgi:acetylornithine/succinyldiaminopimelate/putrescine aminotransferase